MGHSDYQDYPAKAWCRWLDGVGTTTSRNLALRRLQRDILSIWAAVSLLRLKFFLFGILTRHLCACTVQDDCFFFVTSLPKKHSLH